MIETGGPHLGAHVPDAADAVAAAGHEHVQGGVQRQRVHPAEVAVVVPDHLRAHTMQVVSTSRVGCSDNAYTLLRCPW